MMSRELQQNHLARAEEAARINQRLANVCTFLVGALVTALALFILSFFCSPGQI